MKARRTRPPPPVGPPMTLAEAVLRGFGGMPSVETPPWRDEDVAKELFEAATKIEEVAKMYGAMAVHKHVMMKYGQGPDAWHAPRPTSARNE